LQSAFIRQGGVASLADRNPTAAFPHLLETSQVTANYQRFARRHLEHRIRTMPTYLLNCECGKTIPVEVGQAGERVACECGATIEVPTLRKLRHLPVAQPKEAKSRATWSAGKGFVTGGLIVAGLLVLAAAWSRLTEPAVPKFNLDEQLKVVDTELAKITPADTWMRWVMFYKPLAEQGFSEAVYPHAEAIERQIAERRFLQRTLLAVAAVCAVVAIIAAFWPGSRPRGDGRFVSRQGGSP